MSADVANVFVGTIANDGTGDSIRAAFQQVNNNFANIDTRISTGNYGIVYSGTFVQANLGITSQGFTNTQTLKVFGRADISGNANIANLNVNNSFVTSTMTATNNVSFNSNLNVTGPANFANNVVVVGNLTVLGNTTSIRSADLAVEDSIINVHTTANLAPLTFDDGKDIGLKLNYYKNSESRAAALVWSNGGQALEFYANGVESLANTFSGTYGNVVVGSLFTANTGDSIISAGDVTAPQFFGNLTGTNAQVDFLRVSTLVNGNLFLTGADTIYINGSPVSTAAQSFSGGTVPNYSLFESVLEARGNIFANSEVASTSATTGALVVRGGVGITGDFYMVGNAYVTGTVSLGTIQGTPIGGISNSSGTFTEVVTSGTMKSAGNIVAYSGTESTSILTGALVVRGGMGVTGNLNVGGSINNTAIGVFGPAAGNFSIIGSTTPGQGFFTSLRASANLVAAANTVSTNTTTGALVVIGGAGIAGNLNVGGVLQASSSNIATFTATNFSSGNAVINGNSTGAFTTLTATNFSSGNAQITGGNLAVNTLVATNFSTGNAVINGTSTGAFATLTATNFSTGNAQITGVTVLTPSGNAAANLGSSTNWWNTIFGVASQARYADLAENYMSPQPYGPGTVLIFGGELEVDVTSEYADTRVAGAVSTNPAYLMNADLHQGISVALRGRVPVNVIGTVKKGDLLVTSTTPGYAVSVGRDSSYGVAIFAKSLENKDGDEPGTIEAVIL